MVLTKRYDDAVEYLDLVKSFLQTNEAENNLALGILMDRVGQKKDPNHIFIASKDGNEVVFIMMQTARNLIVVGRLEYVDQAIDFLAKAKLQIKGIIGKYDLGIVFAAELEKRFGNYGTIKMRQRIYRLDQLRKVRLVPGKIREANNSDVKILNNWLRKFFMEMGEDISEEDSVKTLERYMAEKSIYVWDDGGLVSMIRKTRATQNGIVVTNVYTPKEYRNRGYATSCVYHFSKMLLKEYRFCTLYTDLANPTSNGIYMKVGYQVVSDSILIEFDR